jgi:DUF971 family protein
MSELDRSTPSPTEIKLHQKSRMLEVSFADGNTFQFPCEFLRVYSPSAEVRGHGPGQEVLQVGKRDVEITHIEPSAPTILLTFSDSLMRIYSELLCATDPPGRSMGQYQAHEGASEP